MTTTASRVAFIVAVAVGQTIACTPSSPAYKFILPDSSYGWIRLKFGEPEARPLVREGKYHVVVVPMSGEVSTSDPPLDNKGGNDKYYYKSGQETEMRRLFGASNVSTMKHTFYICVGASHEECEWRGAGPSDVPAPGLRLRR
jgi:hypothetical protein